MLQGRKYEKACGGNRKRRGCEAHSIDSVTDKESADVLFIGGSIYAGKIDGSLRQFFAGTICFPG